MRVIVSSRNPVKLNAAHDAFSACFPDATIEVEGIDVDSGVSDQPMSDAETCRGAANRTLRAQETHPDADYWLGLEGGIEVIDEQYFASAWMRVLGRDGRVGMSRTPSLPLPPGIKQLVESGLELGDANDKVFSTVNSKHGGGAYGLLSEGRYTRQSIYAQTITIALIPHMHPLYDTGETP